MHKAKKYLGQNFLKSELALKKIIEAGKLKSSDTVLEIGPGKGALTERLLERTKKVIAVEKDKDLILLLQEKFYKEIKSGSLVLVHGDVLDFNSSTYNLAPRTYKLVANIPYYITGAILKKFLSGGNKPERMVLLLQHEVAKRIVARNKKESILSISVKVYGEPKIIMKVPKRYFSPSPKVDSAILLIQDISREFFEKNGIKEEKFFSLIKSGFAHKRKKLKSNLKNMISLEKNLNLSKFSEKRAEDLSLLDWVVICKAI